MARGREVRSPQADAVEKEEAREAQVAVPDIDNRLEGEGHRQLPRPGAEHQGHPQGPEAGEGRGSSHPTSS